MASAELDEDKLNDAEAPMPPTRTLASEGEFSSPISPTRRAAESEQESALQKCIGCLVHFSLYGFNVVSFFACLLIVGGQVAAMSQLNFRSPELAVLGMTIVALWALSVLGLYGVYTSHRKLLRMYAFMLLVLILLQVSIIVTLYQNLHHQIRH